MRFFLFIFIFTLFLNANSFFDDYYIYQSNKFYDKKEYSQALKNLQKIENKNSTVFYNIGNVFYKLGKYEEAIKSYEKVEDSKLSHQKNHNIGNCYIKLENYDKAINHYEIALKFKNDEKSRFNLELSKLKKEELLKKRKRKLVTQTCSVKSFGKTVELREDTIFDRLGFDENIPMIKAKIDKNHKNKVSNTIDEEIKRDIMIDEKKELKGEKTKVAMDLYLEQKWQKRVEKESLKTLIIPLEKGFVNDDKKSW